MCFVSSKRESAEATDEFGASSGRNPSAIQRRFACCGINGSSSASRSPTSCAALFCGSDSYVFVQMTRKGSVIKAGTENKSKLFGRSFFDNPIRTLQVIGKKPIVFHFFALYILYLNLVIFNLNISGALWTSGRPGVPARCMGRRVLCSTGFLRGFVLEVCSLLLELVWWIQNSPNILQSLAVQEIFQNPKSRPNTGLGNE